MPDSTELDDIRNQLKAFETLLAGMASATGASSAMGVGGTGGGGGGMFETAPQPNQVRNPQPSNSYPVGGPGQPSLGPNFAPSGVIFGGGSPYPVDFGPARLQNSLVGLRDLMNTPLGQQLIAKLKARFSGSAGGTP